MAKKSNKQWIAEGFRRVHYYDTETREFWSVWERPEEIEDSGFSFSAMAKSRDGGSAAAVEKLPD